MGASNKGIQERWKIKLYVAVRNIIMSVLKEENKNVLGANNKGKVNWVVKR